MSIQHFAAFWAHSESRGAARLVGVSLAQHANLSSDLAWPSIPAIMAETKLSEKAVREALNALAVAGEFMEMGKVGRQRAWRMTVECPTECDGTAAHKTLEARDIAISRKTAERERKRAQRMAARAAEAADEGHADAVVEAAVEELSRQILPGHEPARTTDRTVVPADPAGMSRQNLPGHRALYSPLEPRTRTTTSRSSDASTTEGSGLAKPERLPALGGGGVDHLDVAEAVMAALPVALRKQLTRPSLARALAAAVERGIDAESAGNAAKARTWAGTGAGAVIAWCRDLEPEVRVAQPKRARCSVHPEIALDGHPYGPPCAVCRQAEIVAARAKAEVMGYRRREGESREEHLARLASWEPERIG